jgi:hypothetical protein
MRPKQDAWSIVLAGYWNRMIFTPEWVGARLFHQELIETKIALLPIFPIIYRHAQVELEVGAPHLIFRPRFNTAMSLQLAEQMAMTVLVELPNTPLSGVGVNFAFIEEDPRVDLVELFNLADRADVAQAGLVTRETNLARKLSGEEGTLNLSLSYDGTSMGIDLNYHTETNANAAARAAVANRVVRLRDAAIAFIKDVYHLQLEEREGRE